VFYFFSVGLNCEGIYRISGVKSKVQALKDAYNKSHPVYLHEHEPNVVAGLVKQFFRDLPEPVLTARLMPKFEQASSMLNFHCVVKNIFNDFMRIFVCDCILKYIF